MLTTLLATLVPLLPQTGNQALALDGSGDRFTLADHPDLEPSERFTIEAWMELPEDQAGAALNKGDGIRGVTNRSYDLRYAGNSQELRAFVAFAGGSARELSVPRPPGGWAHVAVTFDTSEGVLRLLVDGEVVASETTDDLGQSLVGKTLRNSSQPLIFGTVPGFSVWDFDGRIDRVRIWAERRDPAELVEFADRVLTTADLADLPTLRVAFEFDTDLIDLVDGKTGTTAGDAGLAPADDLPLLDTSPKLVSADGLLATASGPVVVTGQNLATVDQATLDGAPVPIVAATQQEVTVDLPTTLPGFRELTLSGPDGSASIDLERWPTLAWTAEPFPGGNAALRLAQGAPGTWFAAVGFPSAVPLSLEPVVGNPLLLDIAEPLTALGFGGFLSDTSVELPVPIPNAPGLVGLTFHVQAFHQLGVAPQPTSFAFGNAVELSF